MAHIHAQDKKMTKKINPRGVVGYARLFLRYRKRLVRMVPKRFRRFRTVVVDTSARPQKNTFQDVFPGTLNLTLLGESKLSDPALRQTLLKACELFKAQNLNSQLVFQLISEDFEGNQTAFTLKVWSEPYQPELKKAIDEVYDRLYKDIMDLNVSLFIVEGAGEPVTLQTAPL